MSEILRPPPAGALAMPAPKAVRRTGRRWWWAPFASVLGLAIITWAFRSARANEHLDLDRWLLWAGLVCLVVPAAAALLDASTTRNTRVGLVALVAAGIYLVKVLHDPRRVGFTDEFVHLANAQGILAEGSLYPVSELIPATKEFPGLEATTVLLSHLSGMGLFASGLVLIGVVKVVGLVAIFLLVERLAGSARIGGLAALIYCGAPNYVFWSSQYSYESLSLPLLLVTLVCVLEVRQRRLDGRSSKALTSCAALLIGAVAVTHHLSSYALAALLWLMVVLDVYAPQRRRAAPLALAGLATVFALGWTLVVAADVSGYLGSIFEQAFTAVRESIAGEAPTRAPFQSGGSSAASERPTVSDVVLALGGVALMGVGVALGLLKARRRAWPDPFALVVMAGGPLLLLAFAARAAPGAWETANRATNFLYIGAAMLVALTAADVADRSRGVARRLLLPFCGFVLIAGGLVIGWQANVRLPRPVEAAAGAFVQRTETQAFVDWASATLPSGSRFIADETSSRLLATAGFRESPGTRSQGGLNLVTLPDLPDWTRLALRDAAIDFVVLDRRRNSDAPLIGAFLPRPGDARELYPVAVHRKFDGLPGARLIYDGGDILVYDVRDYVRRSGG